MDAKTYESLTRMERNCLRLARHDRKTEQIAHELGISPSTVNTHIFGARRKLGGVSRHSAGDMLRVFEETLERDAAPSTAAPDRSEGVQAITPASRDDALADISLGVKATGEIPTPASATSAISGLGTDGVSPAYQVSRQPMWMAPPAAGGPERTHPTDVREARTAFVFDDERFEPRGRRDDQSDDPLRRIALILAIAALTALVAIAAPAIYDSAAKRIADSLERPHPRQPR